MEERAASKPSVRNRANKIKQFRCKNLIAVLEHPTDVVNIGTVIRNVNALGVEKVYVVDLRRSLPDDWEDLRGRNTVSKTSASAVKWTFVKRFDSTDECFDHLEKNGFVSIVTSPHVKGKASIFLHEGDYTAHAKLAVWFGSAARGVSDPAIYRSATCVSIPMFGMIESLNLGTSLELSCTKLRSKEENIKASTCGAIEGGGVQSRFQLPSLQRLSFPPVRFGRSTRTGSGL